MITNFNMFNENKINQHDIDEILNDYLSTALDLNDDNKEFDDKTIYDIDENSKNKARKEIKWFVNSAGKYINKISNIGSDLWLTRNGHGTGFWDRGYSDKKVDLLRHLCKLLGSSDAYVGDDGKVYIDSYKNIEDFDVYNYMKERKFKGNIKKYNL